MRLLTATVSVIFVAACTGGGTSSTQASNGEGHAGDAGGGDGSGSGAPCSTTVAPIVFSAMLDGQTTTDLYVVIAHDGHPTRLTNTPGDELWPAWSPDRTRIAFVRDAQLFVLDVATGTEHLVASKVGRTREISFAAWSPDGTRLVYPYPRDPFLVDMGEDGSVDESYDTTLHFVNADGTNDVAYPEPTESNLPPGIGTLGEPAWSSTNLIAFTLADDCPDCAGGVGYEYSKPDGSDFQDITPTDLSVFPLYPRHGLDWSPDGTRWVFTAVTTFSTEQIEVPGEIATRSVATNADITALTSQGAWWPRYSPDGGSIAFLRSDGLYVMDANGSGEHRVVSATGIRGLDW